MLCGTGEENTAESTFQKRFCGCPVIKSLLARLYRRERAEYQHARMIVIDRVKGMIKYFCHSSSENFKKLLPWANGVYIIKVYKLYRGV